MLYCPKRLLSCSFVCILLLVATLPGCAPVFSELQSARTVGKNQVELTPSYSSVYLSDDSGSEGVQNHIGIQTALGLTPSIDLRARFERVWLKEDQISNGVSIVAVGPKFGLVPDKVAFYLPVGRAFGEGSNDTWQIHPTFLFTLPAVANKVDITFAPKYLFTLCNECDDLAAVNLGAAFSSNLQKWAIRPEYGLLFNPGESGHFGHFSIGFSTTFGPQ